MSRRDFISTAAGGFAAGVLSAGPLSSFAGAAPKSAIRTIAFDAFAIFDPRPVNVLAEKLFPGKGAELSNEWRVHQFEYAWLRIIARRYADFWQVTRESLVFAANKVKVDLAAAKRDELMNAHLNFKPWPDVVPALGELKKLGLRLALLSNLTPTMLDANIKSSALDGVFERVISTDQAKTFKPDPIAYQLGVDRLELKQEEIQFVPSAGWDAAGAKSVGYPTFWVNRQQVPKEEWADPANAAGTTLADLVKYVA